MSFNKDAMYVHVWKCFYEVNYDLKVTKYNFQLRNENTFGYVRYK
jgi:hypothetical protein